MLKAINIEWDIDMDEAIEILDDMSVGDAAQSLKISKEKYSKMTIDERHEVAIDIFHHCPAVLDELMGLPNEVEIPAELIDEDDITDWLSDEYGFCFNGYGLIDEEGNEF